MRFRTGNEILRATDDEAQFARPHRSGNTGHASVNNKYRFRLRRCFYLFDGLRQDTTVKENQRSGGRSRQDAIRTRHALNNVLIRAYDDVYKRGPLATSAALDAISQPSARAASRAGE